MTRGKKESTWLVARRCLAMIRRLQRGPANKDALMASVLNEEGDEAYGLAKGKALTKQFNNDVQRIKNSLLTDLIYDRKEKEYRFGREKKPLLDLPNENLQVMAWLAQTFDEASPYHEQINAFVHRLQNFLPPDRVAIIEQHQADLQLDLGRRDDNHVSAQVRSRLTKALLEKRRVEIEYYSTTSPDAKPRRHETDPHELYFEGGHYYLKGWCHYTVSEQFGRRMQETYFRYRLDRIEAVTLLPQHIREPFPRAKKNNLIYKLSPNIVRGGISRQRWIDFDPEQDIDYHQDGSATVHGTTDLDFFALQSLIRYRGECEVLGDSQMRRMMMDWVRGMGEIYGTAIKNEE